MKREQSHANMMELRAACLSWAESVPPPGTTSTSELSPPCFCPVRRSFLPSQSNLHQMFHLSIAHVPSPKRQSYVQFCSSTFFHDRTRASWRRGEPVLTSPGAVSCRHMWRKTIRVETTISQRQPISARFSVQRFLMPTARATDAYRRTPRSSVTLSSQGTFHRILRGRLLTNIHHTQTHCTRPRKRETWGWNTSHRRSFSRSSENKWGKQ